MFHKSIRIFDIIAEYGYDREGDWEGQPTFSFRRLNIKEAGIRSVNIKVGWTYLNINY